MVIMPEVDISCCNGCGSCVTVCNGNALSIVNNVVTVAETEKCGWCTECEAVCPTGAISCPFEILVANGRT